MSSTTWKTLPVDELDELLLADIETARMIPDEPDDEDALPWRCKTWKTWRDDEPLDLLDHPALMVELSEDPVRLYLKEIGGIDLLDTDQEFWLATRLEAVRRIETLSRGHPLAWDEAGASKRRTRAKVALQPGVSTAPFMMSWRSPGSACWRIPVACSMPAPTWR